MQSEPISNYRVGTSLFIFFPIFILAEVSVRLDPFYKEGPDNKSKKKKLENQIKINKKKHNKINIWRGGKSYLKTSAFLYDIVLLQLLEYLQGHSLAIHSTGIVQKS